jgi:hypothetical protein
LIYAGPITASSANTINAIGYMSGFSDSAVTSATYTVKTPSGMPSTPVLGDTSIDASAMNHGNWPAR